MLNSERQNYTLHLNCLYIYYPVMLRGTKSADLHEIFKDNFRAHLEAHYF